MKIKEIRLEKEAKAFKRSKTKKPSPTKATSSPITLRDYFAGQAMAAFMSKAQTRTVDFSDVKRMSYEAADAMLADD